MAVAHRVASLGMKLSVSLPDDDVRFLDEYAGSSGMSSRSAVLHEAVTQLRLRNLEQDYADAYDEWAAGDADLWDATTGDGVIRAAR